MINLKCYIVSVGDEQMGSLTFSINEQRLSLQF